MSESWLHPVALKGEGVLTIKPRPCYVPHHPLILFLKRLRGNKERIKIISVGSLRTDMVDVVNYAKSYFEVFMDVESLTTSLA
jgi:hypothetical protein